MNTPLTGVIIVAGGSGLRMGGTLPKQFQLLGNEPILVRTIRTFATALPEASIVAVLPAAYADFWRDLSARFDTPSHRIVTGGAERFHSVQAGLAALPDNVTLVAIHDGARPLVSTELILRTIACAASCGSAIPVVAPADSFRETEGDDGASHIIDRRRLRAVQTPQVFNAELLHRAYAVAYDPSFTDDASVVERAGHTVQLCEGERRNFKITEPEDLLAAEALLAAAEPEEEEVYRSENSDSPSYACITHTPHIGGGCCCSRTTPAGDEPSQRSTSACGGNRCGCSNPGDAPSLHEPSTPEDDFASGGAGAIR